MEWQPIETAKRGSRVLLFYPAQIRRGQIALHEMVEVDLYPVGHPRKPTHWCAIPATPKVAPIDYDAKQ